MTDNMGRHNLKLTNCVKTNLGLTTNGGEANIQITHFDPVFIEDFIIGNKNDYIAIAYTGKMPRIRQYATAKDVITHEMFDISADNGFVNLMLNPSPNADLGIINSSVPNPFSEISYIGRVIFTTKEEDRGDIGIFMIAYMIVEGISIKLGESEYGTAVLGTAKTKVEITFDEETTLTGLVLGNKDFEILELEDMDNAAIWGAIESAIGLKAKIAKTRNSIRGFNSKILKIFNVNGGI